MTGVVDEITRVRDELAALEGRMLVINRTIDRLSREARSLREDKEHIEEGLVVLECLLTETPVDPPTPTT